MDVKYCLSMELMLEYPALERLRYLRENYKYFLKPNQVMADHVLHQRQ